MVECDVTESELTKIALGACFLGSGGGGGFKTSSDFITKYLANLSEDAKNRKLKIVDLDDVTEKHTGIVGAYIGAPQKAGDIKCPDAVCEGIKKFMEDKKKKDPNFKGIDYIIPGEIGAVSTITACLTAHKMRIPVLNVDGAGRAVPTLDLVTFTTNARVSVNPTILCSEKTDEDPVYHLETLEIPNGTGPGAASRMESRARSELSKPEFGQKAGLVMWYFEDLTKFKEDSLAFVQGTLTFCRELGGAIQSKPKDKEFLPYIKELFDSERQSIYPAPTIKEMCRGKLISATTSTAGGFDVGVITIEDEGDSGHHYTIIFQNESLILWDSNYADPLAMAPDLISYLIEEKPFTNGDIMENGELKEDLKGKNIVVYGIAAPKALTESDKKIMDKRKDILSNTNADVEHNALPEHYMSILNTVGYYGRCKSLKEKK